MIIMHIQMSKQYTLVKHYYHNLDTIGFNASRKKKDALLLILFSLFSNKQGQCACACFCVCVCVCLRGLHTNDEYAETLRDISAL